MGRTMKQSFWWRGRRASSAPATPRPEPEPEPADPPPPPPPVGCMSMVHYLIFAPGAGCVGRPPTSVAHATAIVAPRAYNSSHHLDDDAGDKQPAARMGSGFEAPRNSLDLDADNPNDIQIGVQIQPVFDALARTKMRRARPTAPSSEAETPRTPSLVARLMGIDGLPETQPASPPAPVRKATTRSSKDRDKENYYSCGSSPSSAPAGNRERKKRVIPESMNRREPLRSLSCNVAAAGPGSLPDTPRGSVSARASWDGPRPSLQALRDSVLDRAAQYMSVPSSPTSSAAGGRKAKKKEAREHAREILRQAKEAVATRNAAKKSKSSSSSPAAEKRRGAAAADNKENNNTNNVVVHVSPPPPATSMSILQEAAPGKPAAANKPESTQPPPPAHDSSRVPLAPRQPLRAKPSRPPPPPPPLEPQPPTRARKPDGCERFATRAKTKQPAMSAGCQPPVLLAPPSRPAAATPSSSAAAAVSSSRGTSGETNKKKARQVAAGQEDPEYGYVRSVLARGGFMRSPPTRTTAARRGGYCSVSAPVDPIVFHLLELELPAEEEEEARVLGPLRHRWNRKLLFQLTQELLAEQLLLQSGAAAAASSAAGGSALLGKVWKAIRAFPAADCRVVGDIDELVARDLDVSRVRRLGRHPAVAEEAGGVAEEVAEQVLEALLGECVGVAVAGEEESASLSWSPSSSSRAVA